MMSLSRWHAHANGVNPPRWMRHWLTDDCSLTGKLIAQCSAFEVRRLRQARALCLADECGAIGLSRRLQVQEREVLLCCDGRAVVFAHTVIPLLSSAADWPFFSALGNRSLGSTLFSDPLVRRDRFVYARLQPAHTLAIRAAEACPAPAPFPPLFARRSLFRRRHGVMLVTEVFLPDIGALRQIAPIPLPDHAAVVID
jgi:chorismate--pyruvate lyase